MHLNLHLVDLSNWSVSGSRGVCGGRGVCWGWILGVSVDQLDADLLGESELDLLASWGSQFGITLLDGFNGVLDFRNGDALLFGQVFTGDAGKSDGLVDAGLDGFGESNLDGDIDGGNDGNIEGCLLGDLLAVLAGLAVTSVTSITAMAGLANGDHLDLDFLDEGDLNSLGDGVFFLLAVGERADLVGDLLNALGADGANNVVAELLVDDTLDGKFNWSTLGFEGGSADLGDLGYVLDGAVVLRLLISIAGGGCVCRSRCVCWGRCVCRSWGVWCWGITAIWRRVAAGHEGEEGQECENLKRKYFIII